MKKLYSTILSALIFALTLTPAYAVPPIVGDGDIVETTLFQREFDSFTRVYVRFLVTDSSSSGTLTLIFRWEDESGPESESMVFPLTTLNYSETKTLFIYSAIETPVTYEVVITDTVDPIGYKLVLPRLSYDVYVSD